MVLPEFRARRGSFAERFKPWVETVICNEVRASQAESTGLEALLIAAEVKGLCFSGVPAEPGPTTTLLPGGLEVK